MAASRVTHVVVDSGGFIRNAPLQNIGENVYTIQEVISEIRDKPTRERLQVLPYELNMKQPSVEAVRKVTEFTKLTGDYPSLSATDIKVMALVYQLESQHVGTEHIKTTPNNKIEFTATKRPLEKATEIAGFYLQKQAANVDQVVPGEVADPGVAMETLDNTNTVTTSAEADKSEESPSPLKESKGTPDVESVKPGQSELMDGDTIAEESLQLDELSDSDSDEEEEDEDNDGWITPNNLSNVRLKMGLRSDTENLSQVCVGCVTTDFAMQNVLLQMGLNVVSIDGMLIKKAKNYVLRCHACFKITTNMTKLFCHHCGNKTLQKVTMTLEEDGSIRYFLSTRRPISSRGTKFSLPMPRGGKHAVNPVLVGDQPMPQQRAAKASLRQNNALDLDFVAQSSPFAVNDVVSRSAQLGIAKHHKAPNYWDRRNPNEVKKRSRRKK